MTDLTDTEIVAACARAMGLRTFGANNSLFPKAILVTEPSLHVYAPLDDRAQASELQEKLRMNVRYTNQWIASCWITGTKTGMAIQVEADHPTNMLRSICLCAARVQIEKEKNA